MFTPGPWQVGSRYGNNRTEIADANYSKALATVWTHDRKRIDERAEDLDAYAESSEGMANARLIASAPELLVAAQEAFTQLYLIATINGSRSIRKGEVEHSRILRMLESAITKAGAVAIERSEAVA